MKIEVNIKKIANSWGIKTAYQLQKKVKLSPSNASRLYNAQVKQISLDTLGKLCEALECELGDMFVVKKSKKSKN